MYLVAIGEIFLKGKNRINFERRLMRNIRSALSLGPDELLKFRNRYLITKEVNPEKLKTIFGIIFYVKCIKSDLTKINEVSLSLIKNEKTFRISAKKSFVLEKSSTKINEEVGEYVLNNKKINVDLGNPEIEIKIEELKNKCYLYKASDIVQCFGGLPVGTGGFVHLIVKDKINSTVAGFLMLKRGVVISLSEDLELLHKFEHGFNIRIRKEKETDIIILDETFENVKVKKDEKFILRPLIGYSKEEIQEIYKRIDIL